MTPIYSELLINKRYSQTSDIWAFGCILYEWALCCLNRRKAFTSIIEITAYFFDKETEAPQITWKKLGLSPHAIPKKSRPYRKAVEMEWEHLNIIFKLIFNREPEERPSATLLKEKLEEFNHLHHG
jgi:serine/threonine protein kinase